MSKTDEFFAAIRKEMTCILATACGASVTMRAVSPVLYGEKILIFTSAQSEKYRQLKENPSCCVGIGGFYAEATAELLGATMLEKNRGLREVYSEKFPGAFDESVPFGGYAAEFILLTPTRLTGWAFENGVPNPEGIPTVPFDIPLV